jgi:hypothetical protein
VLIHALVPACDGHTYQLLDISFEVDDYGTSGPFLFSLVTPAWLLSYRVPFKPGGLTYTPLGNDAEVSSRLSPVSMRTWINKNKPTLFLVGDRMITDEDRCARAAFGHTGTSPYEAGSISDMFRIRELAHQLRPRFRTVLVQSGLSAARVTGEQLGLPADAESYVRAITCGTFDVICSP